MTNTKQDTYDFYDDHAICNSKSGNTYLIMYSPTVSCNCKGFGYYQYCRHSTYVTEHSIKSDDNPPVNGATTIQDNIMHQLIHGNRKD